MSRIYEALQRAEAERQAEREDSKAAVLTPASEAEAAPAEPAPRAQSVAPVGTRALVERPVERPAVERMDTPEPQPFIPPVIPQRIPERVSRPVGERFSSPLIESPPLSASAAFTDRHPAPRTLWSEIRATDWHLAIERFPALEQRGAMVEQFRSLRSRLEEFRAMNRLQSLLVSSGVPQEGKSFIASNLALSLALHKSSKVLLIDGDMRRSTLQEYFGCQAHPGLSDYLSGKCEIVDAMQRPSSASTPSRLIAPFLSNLVVIPGGSVGDRAADLAGSPRFEELLRVANEHFDWIIVDSSPVIPVSDSVSMGRACDAVLLVARSGITSYTVAQRAQHELKASNIIGFVLNAVKNPPAADSYYTYDAVN
ncbi:MAG TPA: CpsD/CapB family tyrosine-protein kinase [Acidobacteriaceae bacterium]|nr:CpsD/CapB family tyrosine-protein kinase [Acidobacteriaceae bacterium]